MARKGSQKSASAFDALVSLRKPAGQPDSQPSTRPDVQPSSRAGKIDLGLAKSVDPEYTKFTTYIRKDTHKTVKVRLTQQERELSDLVEQLLQDWLKQNS